MELIYEFLRQRQLRLVDEFADELACPVLLFKRLPLDEANARNARTTTKPLTNMVRARQAFDAAAMKIKSQAHEYRVFRVKPRADGRAILSIGRGTGNDLVLNDRSVSKHHADLSISGPEVVIVDLQSKNGTKVDGHKIAGDEPTRLAPGSTLKVGSIEMRYLDAHSFYAALGEMVEGA